MHATRIVTFLLGAWIAGCLMVGMLAYENVALTGRMLASPHPKADEIIKSLAPNQGQLLLHHFAAEEYRRYLLDWGRVQIGLGLVVLVTTYFAVERRLLPVILCGLLIVLVLFQYFAIAPELAYRGRESDFPPGNAVAGAIARRTLMIEVYAGTEIAKLVIGGVLASYVFSFKSRRRRRRGEAQVEDGRQMASRAET